MIKYLSLLTAIVLSLCATVAVAVERQVLVEGARIADLPSGSISFAGAGVADVVIEAEERDDGVMLLISYTDRDARHGGTLVLPATVGANGRFELPHNTDPYRVNPTTGAAGFAALRPTDGPNLLTPRYRLTVGYSAVDYETFSVRGPGVEVFPNEGSPLNESDDSLDLDNLSISFEMPIAGDFTLGLTYFDFDGDDHSAASLEPGGGVDVGWLYPALDGGSTGAVAGNVGYDSLITSDLSGSKFGISTSWPCGRDYGDWQFSPLVGIGYIERDLEYEQSLTFPGFPGIDVQQRIDVDEEIWDFYVGVNAYYPLSERLLLRGNLTAIYQTYDADAELVQTEDLFGLITERTADDSQDDSSFGVAASVGLTYVMTPNFSVDAGYAYISHNTFGEVANTTNGDAVLEGESFRLSSDSGSVHGFTVGVSVSF